MSSEPFTVVGVVDVEIPRFPDGTDLVLAARAARRARRLGQVLRGPDDDRALALIHRDWRLWRESDVPTVRGEMSREDCSAVEGIDALLLESRRWNVDNSERIADILRDVADDGIWN